MSPDRVVEQSDVAEHLVVLVVGCVDFFDNPPGRLAVDGREPCGFESVIDERRDLNVSLYTWDAQEHQEVFGGDGAQTLN